MARPTYLTIDLSALQHNVKRVRHFAPQSQILAMVKANAYGHGAETIAHALSDVDALSVASIDEGLALRKSGITKSIVLIEGLFAASELKEAEENQFSLVVHQLRQLEMLEQTTISKPISVWLKINTGMHRLGIAAEQFDYFHQRLNAIQTINKPIGLMTHFAESDLLTSSATKNQLDRFAKITRDVKGPRSLANSAAIMAWPDAHSEWVRPGLMIYGASPFADKTGLDHELLPVMTLSSELIAIILVKQGEKVGYGGTFTAPEDMHIGIVATGYGDGYPQFAKEATPVLVNGKVCPLVGRVSMDMLTVDLRQQKDAKVGDSVTLWGKGLPIEKVANHNHTSAYELFTRMTQRPQRIIKKS